MMVIKEEFAGTSTNSYNNRKRTTNSIIQEIIDNPNNKRTMSDFDKNKLLFNTGNNLVDLSTAKIKSHSWTYLTRHKTNIVYKPTLPQAIPEVAADYYRMLKLCCNNDEQRASSTHDIMASILYQGDKERNMIIVWGNKQVIENVLHLIRSISGNYLVNLDPREFEIKRTRPDLRRGLCLSSSEGIGFPRDMQTDSILLENICWAMQYCIHHLNMMPSKCLSVHVKLHYGLMNLFRNLTHIQNHC
jgi:hypothetical protein